MNADKLERLEKNKKFRKKFYLKGIWKNYAILPPSLILFASLFGLLYLFNTDRLVSIATISCVILLIIGTVWLKAIRKYIVTQSISDDKIFLICLAIPLIKWDGKTIVMFSTGHNRHNKNYLEKNKKEILESISGDKKRVYLTSKAGLLLIPDSDIYTITPSLTDRFLNKSGQIDVDTYVIFNNTGTIKYVARRELESFL